MSLMNNTQYSLSDEDGNPHKSNKSKWSDKLASRYESNDPPVFTSHLPCNPQVVIIDAMFTINTRPLRQTKTIADYFKLLFNYHTTSLVLMRYIFYLTNQEANSLTVSNLNTKNGHYRKNVPVNTNIVYLNLTQQYLVGGRAI